MNLKLWLLAIFTQFTYNFYAQTINGKIIDGENSIGIAEVIFTNIEDTSINFSDDDGAFQLPKKGSYLVEKEGFYAKEIIVSTSNYFVVSLDAMVTNLNEVQILGSNFHQKLQNIPTSISIISNKDFEENTTNFNNIINKAPGVYMHSGTSTTNRITIRGIGSRNLYGTNKIKIYYDDIPLTNGSGESSVEDIELSTLGRIEIIKGPTSSIFGSGLGGTIQLIPHKGYFNATSLKSNVSIGSFGQKKYTLQSMLGNQTNAANIVYANSTSDGYRDNNQTDKESITIATNHYLDKKNNLTVLANYIDLKGFIPSSLNETDYLNNPTVASTTWAQAKGFEATKKGLLGVSWKHKYTTSTQQSTNVFYSLSDTYEIRPFNILEEKTIGSGIRTKISSKLKLLNRDFNWVVGGELFRDKKTYGTFQNLYQQTENNNSTKGNRVSDLAELRTYFNVFFDSNYQLSKKTNLTFGLNFHKTFYQLNDHFNEGTNDSSGNYNFKPKLSPSVGITNQLSKNSMIFGAISHGFTSPTLEEILLPTNKINTDIKPEEGWNFEVGTRGNLLNSNMNYSVSLFTMNVKNLLVAKRVGEDQYVGMNAGETSYNGLEATLNYTVLKNENLTINLQNNATLNNFKFKDYVDFDADYSGNKLTGVPNHIVNTSLQIELKKGLYFKSDYTYVGRIPMRDDNSIFSEKYQLINTTVGYKINLNSALTCNLYGSVFNVFNEKYASMLLINATSFGNSKPRYYYPGEPTNYRIGFNLNYIL